MNNQAGGVFCLLIQLGSSLPTVRHATKVQLPCSYKHIHMPASLIFPVPMFSLAADVGKIFYRGAFCSNMNCRGEHYVEGAFCLMTPALQQCTWSLALQLLGCRRLYLWRPEISWTAMPFNASFMHHCAYSRNSIPSKRLLATVTRRKRVFHLTTSIIRLTISLRQTAAFHLELGPPGGVFHFEPVKCCSAGVSVRNCLWATAIAFWPRLASWSVLLYCQSLMYRLMPKCQFLSDMSETYCFVCLFTRLTEKCQNKPCLAVIVFICCLPGLAKNLPFLPTLRCNKKSKTQNLGFTDRVSSLDAARVLMLLWFPDLWCAWQRFGVCCAVWSTSSHAPSHVVSV